jgi:uncharacterized C2H2 Zn-finger protein
MEKMAKAKCLERLNALYEAEKAKGNEATETGNLMIDGILEAIYEITHDEELMDAFERSQPRPVYYDVLENEYQCPRCNSIAIFSNDDCEELDFCGRCGQALQWTKNYQEDEQDGA